MTGMPPSSSGGSTVSMTRSGIDCVNSTDFGASGTPTASCVKYLYLTVHTYYEQSIHYAVMHNNAMC